MVLLGVLFWYPFFECSFYPNGFQVNLLEYVAMISPGEMEISKIEPTCA